ncbi:nitrous oxide reductase family maturation protein NosD [Mesobacillus subterraneus]|uniref:Nitrous oxide reductase family maturation protein NosD n=1 Tax=Mesobacillus subterraneus TaxID=285983 RepID=A0A3R9FHR8_9BACI|nr:nitrous oxide reductase family maturation protein NosD [Mesobacillus subterraneus]RSD26709.1 nitrous oxide reductase family maturation protein NosD [Mesobacillus subterraneus]
MLKQPLMMTFYIVLLMVLAPVHTSAEELKVGEGQSIQAAINMAEKGDTIIISPGVYKENIEINKEVKLIGEDGSVIDGSGKGNVITVTASNVTIESLTIQHSGDGQENSGIYIKKANAVVLKSNQINNVHFGIFIANSSKNQILQNTITSYEAHFSKRGNGIHLFKGGEHLVEGNEIADVQDGIYFDFTKSNYITDNHIFQSRYGMHFMYSDEIEARKNRLDHNVTGFMVMDSARISLIENKVNDHFHFRGYGILTYEAKNVLVERNEILRNSTGLSLEYAVDTKINGNLIAANQIGLEFMGKNEKNTFTENNFIGNVVQTKISGNAMRLDDGEKGNYWDDYGSFDLSGDGIGEEAYKAGSLYDRLLRKQPYWQFFFESPSIKLWTKAESLFPSFGSANVYDARPLVEPAVILQEDSQQRKSPFIPLAAGAFFIVISLFVIVKGRKMS